MPALSHTVLAVALDDAIEDSLRLLLDSCGVAVRSHANLDSLLQERTSPPACIVVDGDFVDVSYGSFLAAVRETGEPLPVLLLSSDRSAAFAHLTDHGVAGVIRKPLIAEQLAQALAALLKPEVSTLARIGAIEEILDDGTVVSIRCLDTGVLEHQGHSPRTASVSAMKSRFFAPLRRLPDAPGRDKPISCYMDEWAFTAYPDGAGHEIGVARYRRAAGDCAEFAVMTADRWHASGLTRRLLLHLVDRTRLKGFVRLEALVRRQDADLVSLALALGFQAREHVDHDDVLVVGKRLEAALAHRPAQILAARG